MWLDKYREQYPELTIIEDTKICRKFTKDYIIIVEYS